MSENGYEDEEEQRYGEQEGEPEEADKQANAEPEMEGWT